MPDASVIPLTGPRGKMTFAAPPYEVADLHVEVDGRNVPIEALSKTFSIDVGEHVVIAEGHLDGGMMAFVRRVTVNEHDLVLVPIALEPANEHIEAPRCFLEAKDETELAECIEAGVILHPTPPKHGCGACTTAESTLDAPLAAAVMLIAVACAIRILFRRGGPLWLSTSRSKR